MFVQHLECVAPLASVAALYFEPRRDAVDMQAWAAAGAGLTHLRTLGVGRRGAVMLGALFAGCGADSAFPALETLQLRCVWLRLRPDAPGYSRAFAQLRDALAARAAAGHGLARLVLVECINVVPDDVALLGACVGAVEWDGKQYVGTKGAAQDFRREDGGEDDDGCLGLITLFRIRTECGASDSSDDGKGENDGADDGNRDGGNNATGIQVVSVTDSHTDSDSDTNSDTNLESDSDSDSDTNSELSSEDNDNLNKSEENSDSV